MMTMSSSQRCFYESGDGDLHAIVHNKNTEYPTDAVVTRIRMNPVQLAKRLWRYIMLVHAVNNMQNRYRDKAWRAMQRHERVCTHHHERTNALRRER